MSLENVRCECCGEILPECLTEEHHKIHRALGGNDLSANMAKICIKCHKCVHIVFRGFKSRRPKDTNYWMDFLRKAKYKEMAIRNIIEMSKQAYQEFTKRDYKTGGHRLKAISLEFEPDKMRLLLAAAERNGYKSVNQWAAQLLCRAAGIR